MKTIIEHYQTKVVKYATQRSVMQIAWKILPKCKNFKEALEKSWKAWKLKKRFQEHKATYFEFTKLDGTNRPAIGTTRMDIVPVDLHPKKIKETPIDMINYFDVEKSNWRSCHVYQLKLA